MYILLNKEASKKNKYFHVKVLLNQSLEKMKKLLKMGDSEDYYPTLLCFFENDNEKQKQYCFKLKDNFQHEKTIRFEITGYIVTEFKISFRLNGQTYLIQDIFDDSDEALHESLEKMYTLLNGEEIFKKCNKNKKNDKSIEAKQNKNRIITIFFETSDKKINHKLYCNEDSIFKDIEEKLNQKFAEMENIKKHYLCNGNPIDINKTFEENKIKDKSHILIVINDMPNINDESFSNLIENK